MRGETFNIDRARVTEIVKNEQGIKTGLLCGHFSPSLDTVRKELKRMAADGVLVNEFRVGGISRWYTPEYVKEYGFRLSRQPRNKNAGGWQPEEKELWKMYVLVNQLMPRPAL